MHYTQHSTLSFHENMSDFCSYPTNLKGKSLSISGIFSDLNAITKRNLKETGRVFSVPPLCKWDLHSSGMLRSTDWLLITDVSGQPICTIFKGQATWTSKIRPIDWLETSVPNYQPTLCNIAEEWRARNCGRLTTLRPKLKPCLC
jgi:hypothetical protein